MATCIAIIGKDNTPLYLAISDMDKELDLQYRVHAALDVIEEKCSSSTKMNIESKELYLGLLYSTDNQKIYGYITNTKVKFIVVVDSGNVALKESEIRTMFRNLHILYTDAICNPLFSPGEPITSKKFDKCVRNILERQ
ncbi:TRAPPC2L family protein [Megaselia abdita]